jgi:putative ABC transport system ATP-binding protein
MSVVVVRGLNHTFGQGEISQQVLFDVNLTVNPGELVIMTGASGCGKTTLLTLIGALRSAQEGSVQILGRELRGLGKKDLVEARRDIGFIFQAHNLLDALTATENVMMSVDLKDHTVEQLYAHTEKFLSIVQGDGLPSKSLESVSHSKEAIRRALVVGLLSGLDLAHRVDYLPKGLSGGQKQRVAVARALVNHPALILADEPTAALDKKSGEIVVDLLKRMAQYGSTIMVVTHDNRIMDKGDRIVNMKDGKIDSDIRVDETVRICLFLHKVPMFSGLSHGRLVEVSAKMLKETHEPNSVIIRQGDVGDKFYMIKDGEVDVLIDENGSRRHATTLKQGQVFGEMALLTGQPRNATIRTKGSVEVYTLGKQDFQDAMEKSDSMREELIKVFAQRHPRR